MVYSKGTAGVLVQNKTLLEVIFWKTNYQIR